MIGLTVHSPARDGASVLKLFLDLAAGKGGEVVEQILKAAEQLNKKEAEINAQLNAREQAVASKILEADTVLAKANESAKRIVEGARDHAEAVRKELAAESKALQANLDKRQAQIQAAGDQVAEAAAKAKAAQVAADALMAQAKALNEQALAIRARYEKWAAHVDAVKVN